MLAPYQYGCLTTIKRADGMERWLFRWRERGPEGSRERNKVIGTVQDYPERSRKLREAVARLRHQINRDGPSDLTSWTMEKVVEHYFLHELSDSEDGKSRSTRRCKRQLIDRRVLPKWGKYELRDVKTVAVEQWLRTLTTAIFREKLNHDKPLAGGSRAKIRDAMSSIFNHAIRWEFTDKNPITGPVRGAGVRVSTKREREPEVLEVREMQLLLESARVRERAMLSLDMTLGLRRGELAGLCWCDIDFQNLTVAVQRSLVDQHVGKCKTEVSRKLMPLDRFTAADLMAWQGETPYKAPSDYLWATDANRAGSKRGRQPVWLATVMRDHIQPLARKLGISKRVHWHLFRHTFSTLLKANGEDVKVVQELLRHTTTRMTLDTYTQALGADKRRAQSKVVEMIRPRGGESVFSVYRGNSGFSA
jgi:integrase